MGDSRFAGLLIIGLGIAGLALESKGALSGTIEAIITPSPTGPTVQQFAIAAFFLIILSMFLDGRTAAYLFGVIALGAIFYDQQKNGDNSLLSQLVPGK